MVTCPLTDSPSRYSGTFSFLFLSSFTSTAGRSSRSSRTISISTGVDQNNDIAAGAAPFARRWYGGQPDDGGRLRLQHVPQNRQVRPYVTKHEPHAAPPQPYSPPHSRSLLHARPSILLTTSSMAAPRRGHRTLHGPHDMHLAPADDGNGGDGLTRTELHASSIADSGELQSGRILLPIILPFSSLDLERPILSQKASGRHCIHPQGTLKIAVGGPRPFFLCALV